MSMKLRKNLGRIATAFVATAMLASVSAVPASAATLTNGVATANGDNTVTIGQTIDVSNIGDGNNPVVTFTYKIEANDDLGNYNSDSKIPVYKGVMPSGIGTDGWTVQAEFDGSEKDTNGDGKIEDSFNVEFPSDEMTWTGIGVYRYKVTQQSRDNQAIAMDTTPTRYLDVYVGNDEENGGYKILYYTLTTDGTLTAKEDQNAYDHGTKSAGFDASYATYSLTVKKYITGEMGNKKDTFDFTVNFTNLPTGVVLKGGDATVSNGTVTKTLGDNGILVITGIPAVGTNGAPVTYTVSEKVLDADNYTAQYEKGTSVEAWNSGNQGATIAGDEDTTDTSYTVMAVKDQEMSTDNTANVIEFNNKRESSTPTGIVMNVAPYALLVVVAAGACFVFLRKRRED